MPSVFQADGKEYVADRIFSHTSLPTVMEFQGSFFYYAGKPVTERAHLDWLPEPHRTRALRWFDTHQNGGTPKRGRPKKVVSNQVQTVEYTEDSPAKTTEFLCNHCSGIHTFKNEQTLQKHLTTFHGVT